MAKFGNRSLEMIATLHPDIQDVLNQAIEIIDFSVYCGHRTNSEQQAVFDSGKSKARPGQSKHNRYPSEAVDLWKYPIDWNDVEGQSLVAGVILGIAHANGIALRWGGDWDRDGDTSDNGFNDLPHFELMQ